MKNNILYSFLIIASIFVLLTQLTMCQDIVADVKEMHSFPTEFKETHGNEFDMVDLLGLGDKHHQRSVHKPLLHNSASKFLLEMYNDISENEYKLEDGRGHLLYDTRPKRNLKKQNFITKFESAEIEKCNNIITFSSKKTVNIKSDHLIPHIPIVSDMEIGFNTNDVPRDFKLVHSTLRIYQQPSYGKFIQNTGSQMATISLYQKRRDNAGALRILTSLNTTTTYKGWLEFNITRVLNRWLQQKSGRINEVIVGITLQMDNSAHDLKNVEILASDLGLIKPDYSGDTIDLQPFAIGYFNGPELIAKIQKLRFKRDFIRRKRKLDYNMPTKPTNMDIAELPKTCERLNFTLDFEQLLPKQDDIIAPKKYEAYFCGGQCNFPLGSKMNATNHAIVQTLMHLKKPYLPKPCCVPTVLGSISILHRLNDDSINLTKYPQSVAKECGCH